MEYLHYRSRLNPARQRIYDTLYRGLCCREPLLEDSGLPPEEISSIFKFILLDHPQLCGFAGKWALRGGICPRYTLPVQAEEALLDNAAAIAARFSREVLPRDAYLWLLEHVAYDPAAPNSQNAWGAISEGRAVCKGIAKAFQLLMLLSGVPSLLVEGSLDGVTKHVWNMVFWEGRWQHLDVTMGYPCFWHLTGARDVFGGYLLTTDAISRSHQIRSPQLLPETQERKDD